MVFEITTSTVIAAPVSVVSAIVFDFPAYKDWNPFVRRISGSSTVGEHLDISVGPPGSSPMDIKPVLLKYDEQELRWVGTLWSKMALVAEHYFVMKAKEVEGIPVTEFIHGEKFSGLLSPLMKMMMGKATEEGFRLMNKALKERAEKMAQEQGAAGGS